MTMLSKVSMSLLGILLFSIPMSFAQETMNLPDFDKNDHVLILSPHPDDETIGVAGAIQKANEAGAKIKVVWLTNGENNEVAFIVYEKKLVLAREALLKMGELRRTEAINALNVLGIDQDKLMFLGYPDFGTLDIFCEYWRRAGPFRSMLARVTHVPYPESPSYGKPYLGRSRAPSRCSRSTHPGAGMRRFSPRSPTMPTMPS